MINGKIQHILFTSDLSEAEEAVLTTVLDLARREEARVTILHVIELLRDIPFEDLESFYRALESRSQRKLAEMQGRFTAADLSCDYRILFGDRVQEIVRFSGESDADLLVVRGRRVRENGGTAINRVGYRVTLLANCSVLLLNG